MTTTLQILLLLSILIFAAKMGGLLSTRLGQSAVLGELIAGLIVGPTILDLLHNPLVSGPVTQDLILELGELGVIFLMFIAGLEIDLDEMLRSGKVALLAGTLGVLVPLVLGTLAALALSYPLANSIFVGLILTATSVSISAQTLLEMGVIGSKEGLALLGAAVVDDVLGILLLSFFLALSQDANSGPQEIFQVLIRMVLFFAISIGFGLALLPRLTRWVGRMPVSEGLLAFVIVLTLLYAWSAEIVGEIAAITGAFMAGVFFARTDVRRMIASGMHTLTYAFFVPIFLISVGLRANARALGADGLFFAGVIIIVAVFGKVGGSWLGAWLGGYRAPEALRVGVGMISRGEVGLIIAAIGLERALITEDVYAAMILMVLVTTLITPVLLRSIFPQPAAEAEAEMAAPVPARDTTPPVALSSLDDPER
jgi:Kef-type K+ transport system membrane component KefB